VAVLAGMQVVETRGSAVGVAGLPAKGAQGVAVEAVAVKEVVAWAAAARAAAEVAMEEMEEARRATAANMGQLLELLAALLAGVWKAVAAMETAAEAVGGKEVVAREEVEREVGAEEDRVKARAEDAWVERSVRPLASREGMKAGAEPAGER
jgi:hypothetical protein